MTRTPGRPRAASASRIGASEAFSPLARARPGWRRNRSILSGAIRRESRPNPAGMWLAGNLRNWPLAEYELSQMNATLQDARALFPNVPAADTSAMSVEELIDA